MLLRVEKIKKIYGNSANSTKALNNITFSVKNGEFISIMGPSGSGKTTLLNCISTIDAATSGNIYLNNQDITSLKDKELAAFRRNNLGFIFQDSKLLDILTIEENIILPLTIKGMGSKEISQRLKDISSRLSISNILTKYPYEVSGGQKQRCAAARAIITNPKLILADEPTGALDSITARALMNTLESLNKSLSSTILLVTHDPMAASYSQKVFFLKDGRIFHELSKHQKSNTSFYQDILKVLSTMEG